ncbi:MAG: cell division protein FtsQ/DivIB [Fibrobacterota bacterium]
MAKRIGTNEMLRRRERREKIARKKPGRRILFAGMLLVASLWGVPRIDFAWYGMQAASLFRVNSLVITGNSRFSHDEIAAAANLESIEYLSEVDEAAVVRNLTGKDGISAASVDVSYLNRNVHVSVQEHRPRAFVVLDQQVYFMNDSGGLWPFTAGGYFDIPVLYGLRDTIDEAGVHRVTDHDYEVFRRLRATFEKVGRYSSLLSVNMFNRNVMSLSLKGITPEIRVSTDLDSSILGNMETLFSFVKSRDIRVDSYIDLSYNDVAFIR